MKIQAEAVLKPLIGLPLWDIGRAPSMEWLIFGNERRVVKTKDGGTKIVSNYSLHIQCAWRLRGPDGVLFGSRYRGYPITGENHILNTMRFGRGTPPQPGLEARVRDFYLERGESPLLVLGVSTDDMGGFQLSLSDGYVLEVFPDCSQPEEDWRLFTPYSDKEHLISNGFQMLG